MMHIGKNICTVCIVVSALGDKSHLGAEGLTVLSIPVMHSWEVPQNMGCGALEGVGPKESPVRFLVKVRWLLR